jgi:hypothetical protein
MSARSRFAAAFVGAILLAAAAAASACGVCVEDKVAVTYDHAVITRAAQRHHVVVFAAIEGRGDAHALARSVRAAAARLPGVDRDSIRTAAEPAAISFALDPGVAAPEATLAALEKSGAGLRLPVLRIVR